MENRRSVTRLLVLVAIPLALLIGVSVLIVQNVKGPEEKERVFGRLKRPVQAGRHLLPAGTLVPVEKTENGDVILRWVVSGRVEGEPHQWVEATSFTVRNVDVELVKPTDKDFGKDFGKMPK